MKNPLSKLTQDKSEQRNLALLGTNVVLRHASIPLYTGDVIQAWYTRLGLQPDQIALIGIPGTIVQYIMMLVGCAVSDRITKRVRAFTLLTILGCCGALCSLLITIGPSSFRTFTGIAILTIAFGIFGALTSPFYGNVSAMVEARAFHNSIRGRFWSIFGMAGGLVGLGIGAVATLILKHFGFPSGYAISYCLGIGMIILSAFFVAKVKELPELQGVQASKKESVFKGLSNIIKMREFRILMPANLMRGLGDGAGSYITYVAFKQLGLSDEYAGYCTLLSSFANFGSYGIIGLTLDRFGAGKVLPVVEVLLVIGLLGSISTTVPVIFLCFFFLWKVMQQIEASTIPLAHYQIVPVEVIGNFSGIRLMMLSITVSISGTVTGFCLAKFSPLLVFAVCAVLKLIAGALYSYGLFTVKKHVEKKAAPAQ